MPKTVKTDSFNFPCGETHVRLLDPLPKEGESVDMEWNFTGAESVVQLLLSCDAIRRAGLVLGTLKIPYFPFSRQDRVNTLGEPLSVAVMATLINGLRAQFVQITDPHSDVTPALLDRCRVIEQYEVFAPMLPKQSSPFHLVSPDAGALKKIYKLAKVWRPLDVIECSKKRDVHTGAITETVVHASYLYGYPCIIVDDICDGGRTFIELAKKLKRIGSGPITLMVTHGFFTQGLEVFDGLIDAIYTRKGKVK